MLPQCSNEALSNKACLTIYHIYMYETSEPCLEICVH